MTNCEPPHLPPSGHEARSYWREFLQARQHGGRWRPPYPHTFDPRVGARRKHRFLLVRFLFLMGFLAIFLCMALAFLLVALRHAPEALPLPTPPLALREYRFLLFPLLILIVGGGLAVRAFQHFTAPLAEVMMAADAVADGDFQVRVRERGSPEFARMAASFNRMTEALQRADQQRRNLTADVAHELRTPLQIIQGNLEGVLDGVYNPTPGHITATLDETRLLARLVEDLRTLSLAEAGQLPLHLAPVDVCDVLADAATSFSGPAEAAGITLETRCDPAAALIVQADVARLNQILGNLLSNALRYTPEGGRITLCAAQEAEGVCLQVQDTGSGIPPDDLPYIFDRFWRGDRSRTHIPGVGSGLGLAIARQLVHAHGGRITVQSVVGQGTRFQIFLPL
ncbi:MAG TPA: HAMP domain-containing sensor histidine kinase [Anaerolineae bacterium]|nr:HAMP domain-containing sensor histidine kinase [Anaerolineae bacterium]